MIMVPLFLFGTVLKSCFVEMEDDKVQFITVKCFCLRIEGINALQVTHIWGDKERGNCCTADVFIWLLTKG